MVAGVVAALVLALAAAGCGGSGDPLAQARAVAGSADGFATGPDAGERFATIAQHLLDAVDACDPDVDGARCPALQAASGYAQVVAVRVLRCTAPGRFEARTGMAEYLAAIDALGADDSVPDPPPIPDCA